MLPDKQMEVIPRIWKKCTHLRKLSFNFQSSVRSNMETKEAFWNFNQLIYQLQVRGLTKTIISIKYKENVCWVKGVARNFFREGQGIEST